VRLPNGRGYVAPLAELRTVWRRRTLPGDLAAGAVLGIESVPDALARGVLAGVNPLAGLNAYLFGMLGGALFTATPLMAVQSTGALAVIVADVGLNENPDPARALFTLSMLTGIAMLAAGVLRLGKLLRFVSTAVLTGFLAALGINIVLSQLTTLTGYPSGGGGGAIARFLRMMTDLDQIDLPSTVVGVSTIVLVVVLTRTRLGPLGMVVAVLVGSGLAAVFAARGSPVVLVGDLVDVQRALPVPVLPDLASIPNLVLPALSLAFVGLVQGAGVAAAVCDGEPPDASQDFVGQGVGNLVAGLFQGMPVGGSSSASALAVAAGARTRLAPIVAALVIALSVLLLGGTVELIAMPALAALLIVVGAGTVRPGRVVAQARIGPVQLVVVTVTLVLTLLVPLQYAVLVGVGLSLILHALRQSSQVKLVQLHLDRHGRMREAAPPAVLAPHEVVVLQPYGSVFFASAEAVERQLPALAETSRESVVILRFRGVDEVGMTVVEMLRRYVTAAGRLRSRVVLVVDSTRLVTELQVTGLLRDLGEENLYRGDQWVGRAVRRAHRDAAAWVSRQVNADRGER
jgi:sulfate permease, SulP family